MLQKLYKATLGGTVLRRTALLISLVAVFALAVLTVLYLTGALTSQTTRQACAPAAKIWADAL